MLCKHSAGFSKKNVAQLRLRQIILTQNTGKEVSLPILQANKAFILFSLYFVLLKNNKQRLEIIYFKFKVALKPS